jgi:hypothetical protein
MLGLVGWMVIGAALGFIYAWRRTAPGFAHSAAILDELQTEDSARRRGLAHARGRRIGSCLSAASAGAVLGLLTWMAGRLLILSADPLAGPDPS